MIWLIVYLWFLVVVSAFLAGRHLNSRHSDIELFGRCLALPVVFIPLVLYSTFVKVRAAF